MAEQLCRAGANLSLLDKVMAMDTYQYCNIDKLLCLQKKKGLYNIAKSYSPTIHKMLLNVMSHSRPFSELFLYVYAWSQLPKKESKGAALGSCDEEEGKDGDQPASVTRQDKDVSIVSSYT